MPLLGAHMSIAGGLHLAFERIRKVKGEALQIFTGNQRQWRHSPLTDEEVSLFKKYRKEWGDFPIASHDSYLINLASPKKDIAERSVSALSEELGRCERLAIPYLIMHPGAHLGEGVEAGIKRLAANLDRAMAETKPGSVAVLLETTAAQGSALGSRFEELAAIIENSSNSDRLFVCLDTCHIFAAGYDIRTQKGYEETFRQFDKIIGFERLKFIHLNDSKSQFGSKVDRHEHIGKGAIGLRGFKRLLNDPRFAGLPMVLETPKGRELTEDKKNLRVLRGLISKPPLPPA